MFHSAGDRRKHPRARLSGELLLIRDTRCLGRYRILNVSAGGVLLLGESPLADGERVHVLMRIAGEPLLVTGALVVRKEMGPAGPAFALSFQTMLPYDVEAVQEAVLAALEGRQRAGGSPVGPACRPA